MNRQHCSLVLGLLVFAGGCADILTPGLDGLQPAKTDIELPGVTGIVCQYAGEPPNCVQQPTFETPDEPLPPGGTPVDHLPGGGNNTPPPVPQDTCKPDVSLFDSQAFVSHVAGVMGQLALVPGGKGFTQYWVVRTQTGVTLKPVNPSSGIYSDACGLAWTGAATSYAPASGEFLEGVLVVTNRIPGEVMSCGGVTSWYNSEPTANEYNLAGLLGKPVIRIDPAKILWVDENQSAKAWPRCS